MLFKRSLITTGNNGGVPERLRAGGGLLANIQPSIVATNADMTMTVAQMAGGMVQYSSFSAGRAVTTPTAALILAAAPDMDIGDSFSFIVSAVAAFAATWVAGVGVTLAGRATTPASSWSIITVTKTAATTVTWNVS
jgi:hypothetical protein